MVYNPLDEPVHRELTLPVYYTGLTDRARPHPRRRAPQTLNIDRQFNLRLPIDLPARGYAWIELSDPSL